MTKCVLGVFDEDPDHHDKDDNIEEQDDKDGAQESSKEYCSVRDEAAGEREHNHSMLNQLSLSGCMYCALKVERKLCANSKMHHGE